MQYHFRKNYSQRCVVSNNRVMGLGATINAKDALFMPLTISSAINGVFVVPGFMIAFFAENIMGALPWLLGFGGLFFFQLLLIGLVVLVYNTAKHTFEAPRVSNAYRSYRLMDKVTKGEVRPLIRRIEQCVKDGEESDLRKRLDKFEEVQAVITVARKRMVDNSDIEQADAYIKGMKELKA